VFSQLLQVFPRHEFRRSAARHHRGRALRAISRWDQFVALAVGQLTGRSSLRDLVANLAAQGSKLYHLGARVVSRSSLARVNRDQPAALFKEVFHELLARTQQHASKHSFRFKGKLISLDASFIEMTASVFPWAEFRSTKGAIKLHVGLDHDGYLPAFVAMTDGKGYDVDWARTLDLPAGSVVVFDRGYIEYKFFKQLMGKKIRFVTRYRKDIRFTVLERRAVDRQSGLTSDQTIRLQGKHQLVLRRVGYRDAETGRHYHFLTNATDLPALTVAQIYRERWQIELFFKWIKQNLKIKTFLGTSPNAVLSQIWVALCVYLLLAYLRFRASLGWSMQQILRLLQLNLFERRPLLELLQPPRPSPKNRNPQLALSIT
jgi:putative transposase